ncbi:hexose transporter 2 [Favolaschia claudopus]|uniref:Hexose transporter 2 n=1 Tax=Favolaschia claudopus TaxID=2862362 RepID=A0AAW0EGE5_9AGAR
MTMTRAVPHSGRATLLAVFIAFGGFLFGYDIGVISGCLIMPDFIDRFGERGSDGQMFLSPSRQSIITSLLSAGTFVGALGQAFTSDRFGRRGSILIWSAIFTVGVAIQTGTVRSIVQLTIGRFIAGLGVGALSAIVPLYNGETAPKALRGTFLVLYQLQIITGIFLSYVLDLATHSIKNSASWRVPVGLQLVWGLALLSGIFFLPESPRHLLGNNKVEEARRVIADLNAVPLDDPLVSETVSELQYALNEENAGGKATWAECFSSRNAMWKRTGNGMMLQFIQQLNGQNFYYYYGDTFFASSSVSLSPYVIQTILGAVSVAGTIPALYLIEAWGRRRSLLTGAILEAICAIIAGLVGHFTLAPPNTPLTHRNKQGGDTLIAFAVLHVFSFSIFWGPTPWVYLGEVGDNIDLMLTADCHLCTKYSLVYLGQSFPLRVRPKSIALGSATNWLWNFLLSFFAPRISNDIGPLILLIFFGMLIFGYVYVYLCIPETKGLSLEEVDELYRSGVKPWHSTGWTPRLNERFHETEKTNEERRSNEMAAATKSAA